ncbi:MAG TPA: glycosyltransferase family 4 protein [Solirubrobacterales bacterium]|nr:glycosyltransferase family 4 protein [Solirubrobacterales bacterium]
MLSAVMFAPRGGSAHAARTLARHLPAHGWAPTILSGSRGDLSPDGDAWSFYAGLDVHAVDFTAALRDPDPFHPADRRVAPMHPSYEDRPGAPDRVFASLDDLDLERQVRTWGLALREACAAQADVLHVHHLTPINEAAQRLLPWTPIVGHLHGTELLMLEAIDAGPPSDWPFAERWAERMRAWARRCFSLLVAPGAVERAATLLELDRSRLVEVPNGIEIDRFERLEVDRADHWEDHLVREPRGWRAGGAPGSVRYEASDLEALRNGTVLIYVGRFTEVKRLGLLIRAFARAQERLRQPAALVLVGGHPGEWEGEHPLEAIEASGARDVFLAGWHEQDRLAGFLSASDVILLPSAREQFGQALIEGMACGLPAIAAESYGASRIVADEESGWLVPADDRDALAAAIVDAVNRPAERGRRGERARRAVVERYGGERMAARVAAAFHAARGRRALPMPAERRLEPNVQVVTNE